MGTIRFQIPHMEFLRLPEDSRNGHRRRLCTITCGIRDEAKKPSWRRSFVPSREAIEAVRSLKLAKSTSRLEQVSGTTLSRLLKADLFDTLAELQRQNEWALALKVFEFVRKEMWDEPEAYCDMIQMLGKNKMVEMAEQFFAQLVKEGLKPDTRVFSEMIGAYLRVGRIEKAMETYETLKASGCAPDKLTFTILIRGLKKEGKEELAVDLKKECAKYLEDPKIVLEKIEQEHPKRRSLNLV